MSREVEITRVEDAGQASVVPITKNPIGAYEVEVIYVLATGRRILDGVTRRLLRDAKTYRATLPIVPEPGTLFALFNERGDMIGTKARFYIGGKRG